MQKSMTVILREQANIIGDDAFETWCKIMDAKGIDDHKKRAERMEAFGFVYKFWELTRWERKNRSVPQKAQKFFVAEIFYHFTSGEKIARKGSPTFFKICKFLSVRMDKKYDND